MPQSIDLDALAPESVTIHINNQDIVVKPPSTLVLFRIGGLGQKMQNIEKLTDDEVNQLESDLKKQIINCIPELENIELSTPQLLKLVAIISEMGTPAEAKELQERGITASGPKAQSN